LRKRLIHLLESDTIKDKQEREKLQFLLKTKKWNPYCIRHSSITYDSDYLPEYALKKKVRWSINSKQGSRYIKRRMGNNLKQKILVQNSIISEQEIEKKPSIINCPLCNLVNAVENKYCSKCSYPLVPSAFDEIKAAEDTILIYSYVKSYNCPFIRRNKLCHRPRSRPIGTICYSYRR
jgi:integrase/recombinase XerD